MKTNVIAAAALLALSSGFATAQTTAPVATDKSGTMAAQTAPVIVAPKGTRMRVSNREANLKETKGQIEQMLKGATSRADYASMLGKNGFRISSINADKKDFLEYEVVKGTESYEVRLDFKDGAAIATDIDVTNNMWRAPSTKALLKDSNYKMAGTMVADPDNRYSDSRYRKASDDEKEQLEKLKTGDMTAAQYLAKLKARGYKITATNDKDADSAEYEISKGDNSYEVQIDMDAKTKLIKDVDVSSNYWDAPGTERTKDAKDGMKKPAVATKDRPAVIAPMVPRLSNADRAAALKDTKEQIEQMLKGATSRADYAAMLEKKGFRISSINADKKDFLEYEVVKGAQSYEVRLDFKDGAAMATDIDVTDNMWRAPSTKAMLLDNSYEIVGGKVADPDGRYSDSRYRKASDDEKEQLEKLNTGNMTAAQYMAKLKARGYKITATNDKEADSAEYEILKGDNSYEVQIDMDAKTKMIKDIGVSSNFWDAPGTEQAKDAKKAMKK